MRSKTSFFNPAIFWKNAGRFWPVWGGYLAAWVLLLPVGILSMGRYGNLTPVSVQSTLYNAGITGGVALGAVFAVFSAMAVWSFLYNARSAHGFACLPIRREGLFLTVTLSGLLPLLLVNILVGILTALSMGIYGVMSAGALLSWFGVVSLVLVFFYGFATLCAQLTGNIVVLPLVYGVLNFVAFGAETMLRGVFGQFIYGMSNDMNGFATRYLSPPVGIVTNLQGNLLQLGTTDDLGRYAVTGYVLQAPGWVCAVLYGLAGILLLIGALLLFRARRMETAGDVVAVKPLKPVFRWCMALGCGLLLSTLLYAILNRGITTNPNLYYSLVAYLLIGALVGWFAAEMLMKKSFRVFHKRTWGGFGICCLVILALMLGIRFDLFGYERRVPASDRVESVTVIANGEVAELSSPLGIGKAQEVHRQIIADKQWNYNGLQEENRSSVYCVIRYQLRGGGTLSRAYHLVYEVDPESNYGASEKHDVAAVNELLNLQEAIDARKATAFPLTRDNLYHAQVSVFVSAREGASMLGYTDPADYVLMEYSGLDPATARNLDGRNRILTIAKAVLAEGRYDPAVAQACFWDYPDYEYLVWEYDRGKVETDWGDAAFYDAVERFVETLDWSRVYFNHSQTLTAAEAMELYHDCILPDLADGALGRVWTVTDREYMDTVYAARIDLEGREYDPQRSDSPNGATRSDYRYASFYTIPTIGSLRTNAWFKEHGLKLRTEGETTFASSATVHPRETEPRAVPMP